MYEFDSRVRFSETDENRRLTLNGILNYFQDCCTFQSEDLGIGLSYLAEKHRMWALLSWKIVVERYPEMGERVRVLTLPYAMEKIKGRRNFLLLDEDGRTAACADSVWVLMDTARQRPARIEEDMRNAYELSEKLDMEYEEDHIRMPEGFEEMESFPIHKFHLDVNHHVNNGQYVQLAGEYLPENFAIREMRAEYRRSAVLGDMIFPQVSMENGRCTVSLADEKGKPYAVVAFKGEVR